MLEILRAATGVDIAPEHVAPRIGDVRHSFADLSAAAADLGYRPSITFEDGLARTVEHFSQWPI